MSTRNERKRKAKARQVQSAEKRVKGFVAIQKASLVSANKAKIKAGALETVAASLDAFGGLVMPEYGYSGRNILSTDGLKGRTHSLRAHKSDKPLTVR